MGEYHLGKKHGKGTYTMKDGTRYEGDFKDGMPMFFFCSFPLIPDSG
jgi:hypothetical protein